MFLLHGHKFKPKVLSPIFGIKLGRLGSYDIFLPGRPDAFFLSESRNLYRQSWCQSVSIAQNCFQFLKI